MIQRAKFAEAWKHLCGRFNRPDDPQQAAAYYEYLTDEMDTDEFLQAARALWSGARFFPAPADFVTVHAQGEWPLVMEVARGYSPPAWEWVTHWKNLSPRSQAACKRLGGVDVVRALYERDPMKLKAEWEKAYEQALTADVLALPVGENVRRLRPA
jgi:hypothetical protein